MADYLRPKSLAEALTICDRQACRPLAGGTDFYPDRLNSSAWSGPSPAHFDQPTTLDLSAIDGLRGIHDNATQIEIGAMVTWSEAIASDLPTWFDGVRLAAREVGGLQIQNRATLVGNLCNASPAADGVPALMALNAKVRLQSQQQQRELLVEQFVLGNRQVDRRDNELVTAIIIPKPSATHDTCSTFLKLGARRYLVISIAMVAITLNIDDNTMINRAAVVVGACSEVAQRLTTLEQRLLGKPLEQAPNWVQSDDFSALTPLDDIRASAEYRLHSAQILVKRGLQQLASQSIGRAA